MVGGRCGVHHEMRIFLGGVGELRVLDIVRHYREVVEGLLLRG